MSHVRRRASSIDRASSEQDAGLVRTGGQARTDGAIDPFHQPESPSQGQSKHQIYQKQKKNPITMVAAWRHAACQMTPPPRPQSSSEQSSLSSPRPPAPRPPAHCCCCHCARCTLHIRFSREP
eukprot:scaffold47_cov112-Isochrysis_galbana.AAC.16